MSAVDPDGLKTTYSLDGYHAVLTITDPESKTGLTHLDFHPGADASKMGILFKSVKGQVDINSTYVGGPLREIFSYNSFHS